MYEEEMEYAGYDDAPSYELVDIDAPIAIIRVRNQAANANGCGCY